MSSFLGGGGGVPPAASGNLTFYVASTGSDSNPGTLAQPFFSIQHAWNVALGFDYKDLYTFSIIVANGTYNIPSVLGNEDVLNIVSKPINLASAASITGNNSSPGSVLMNVPAPGGATHASLVYIRTTAGGTQINVGGFKAHFANAGVMLRCGGFDSVINITGQLALDAVGTNSEFFITETGGTIQNVQGDGNNLQIFCTTIYDFARALGNYTILSYAGNTVTMPANLTVVNHFIDTTGTFQNFGYSRFYFFGNTYTNSGTTTGDKVLTGTHSVVTPAANALSEFPGVGGAVVTVDDSALVVADPQFGGGIPPTNSSPIQNTAGLDLAPDSWIISKVTSGPRQIVFNDGGTYFYSQIGTNVNTQTASYTLALADDHGTVEMNVAGANTLTVPTNASVAFPTGAKITVVQAGAGATTIAGAGGVTVHNAGTLSAQWASVVVYKRATNEWVMVSGAA